MSPPDADPNGRRALGGSGDAAAGDAAAVPRSLCALPHVLLALLFLLLLPLSGITDLRTDFPLYATLAIGATLVLYAVHALIVRRGIAIGRRGIVIGALILRAALLPMSPILSDDIHRYLWDGRLLASGVDPYRWAPAAPELARFHDELYRRQGYPTTQTVYPPGAQLLFATGYSVAALLGNPISGGYVAIKLLLLLAETIGILLLLRVLEMLGVPRERAILYAWHPLPIIELAGQGHSDALWVLALAGALYGYASGRRGGGIAAILFGGAMRLHPLSALPLQLRFTGKRSIVPGLLAGAPFLLLLALLLDPARLPGYLDVLIRFTSYFEFNGGVYYAIKRGADLAGLAPSNRIAGGIVTGLQLLFFACIWLAPLRDRSPRRLAGRMLLLVTVQLVLAAKVHVWYAAAPLLLAPLLPASRLGRAWLWMALAAPLTYLAGTLTPFREPVWILVLEWGGFLLAALLPARALPSGAGINEDRPADIGRAV